MLFLTHHKCASSLATLYLDRLCQVNGLRFFTSALGNQPPSPDHDVSFLVNASYPFLSGLKIERGVHIIRNPLNVAQSAYYSHLRSHPIEGLPALAAQRRVLEQCSAEEGMALTVAFCERNDFYRDTPGPLCALRQWDYADERFATLRMEDFGDRIDLALAQAIGDEAPRYTWPAADEFTFQAMSGGRKPGIVDESSPYRSGNPDAWRRELPRGVIAFIRAHHRPLLERFYPESLAD